MSNVTSEFLYLVNVFREWIFLFVESKVRRHEVVSRRLFRCRRMSADRTRMLNYIRAVSFRGLSR